MEVYASFAGMVGLQNNFPGILKCQILTPVPSFDLGGVSKKPWSNGSDDPYSSDHSGPGLRERGSERQDHDGGRGETLLVRRSALLPASPLGPAQPSERGRAGGGGAAAEQRHFCHNRRRLAGITQV